MASPYSLETQAKIAHWRQKIADGTMTLDEMREAVRIMKGDRKNTALQPDSKPRTAKAKAHIKSADEMLDELGS